MVLNDSYTKEQSPLKKKKKRRVKEALYTKFPFLDKRIKNFFQASVWIGHFAQSVRLRFFSGSYGYCS